MIKKNYKMINKILNILIIIGAVFVFVVLSYNVLNNYIEGFDNYFYDMIMAFKGDKTTIFFKIITYLGSGAFLVLFSILLCFILKNKRLNIFIFINLVLSFLVNFGFKQLFARTRPLDINLIAYDGYSFPSGHAMVSMAFYGFLIYLLYIYVNNKKIKYPLMIVLGIIICLIAISRVYLGVHFASDILAGVILGLLYLLIYVKIINNKIKMIN